MTQIIDTDSDGRGEVRSVTKPRLEVHQHSFPAGSTFRASGGAGFGRRAQLQIHARPVQVHAPGPGAPGAAPRG